MSNQYTWNIVALDCKPQLGNLTNYVVTSHWTLFGDDANNHTGSVYGTVSFNIDPEKPDFTPFDQLSQNTVIQWTQDALGANQVSSLYTNVDTQIENQINPPLVTPKLPWAANTSTI